MDSDMITDITLDHLPDLSDASLSFQIPAHMASADLLLADHTDDVHLLCNASDDDPSFGSPRGPTFTLSELTPRVHPTSLPPPPSPTPLPFSSAKPPQLTLGHASRAISIHRQLDSPLVSVERLRLLRAQVATLGHADNAPSHVHVHVMEPTQDGDSSLECPTSSPPNSKLRNSPPGSEDPNLAGQDVVTHTRDNALAHANNLTHVPASHRNPRMTASPTIAGGSSKRPASPTTHVSKKRKNNPARSMEVGKILPSAPRQLTPPQSIATDAVQERVPPASASGDTDVNSENQITQPGTGAMAQRLVSYSQKIISSIGLYKPSSESSFTEASNDAVRVADIRIGTRTPATPLAPSSPPQPIHDIPSAQNEPLRLSEISPHKPPANAQLPNSPAHTGTLQHGGHAVSPMRPPKKRLSLDADLRQQNHRHKRGKIMPAEKDSGRGSSEVAISQDHAEQVVTLSETRDSGTPRPNSILPNARTKYKPQYNFSIQCKGPTLDAFPYLSRSRRVRESINKDKDKRDDVGQCKDRRSLSRSSLQRRDKKRRNGPALRSVHARQHSGPTSTSDLPLIEKKQNATCVAALTKPAGFTFRVDARLEARKREGAMHGLAASEPGKTHADAVPESQAPTRTRPLLASHPCTSASTSTFAFHSHNHRPPVPFFFCTEERAKERERFDAMVKCKEEEMQRLKEERRRLEAEEEALAIRELRRKAVPKANDVPEWYADMPKKKGTVV